MAGIYSPTGIFIKDVKNLGWLLKHNREVVSFTFTKADNPKFDGILVARLRDGRVYTTSFASATVCRDFVRRPVFIGLPLHWCGGETVC